jgi:glucokinase
VQNKNIFAADLGGTKCAVAVVNPRGRIVSHGVEAVDISSPSAPIEQIVRLARQMAKGHPPRQVFAATAVAVPGLSRRDGTVWAPNLPGWERMPLRSRLQQRLGVPAVVESDRNAALLGECWQGAARGKADAIVLIIGTGIGAGILCGGQVVRGAHELSGCAGWLTVFREQDEVAARVGQLESLCAGPSIARAAREYLLARRRSALSRANKNQLTASDVAAAARGGDHMALEVLAKMGTALGFGIANIVSLFDPEVVVLTGGMASAADLYMASLKKAVHSRAQPLAAKQVEIAISKLGQFGNLLGCASLAWAAAGKRNG